MRSPSLRYAVTYAIGPSGAILSSSGVVIKAKSIKIGSDGATEALVLGNIRLPVIILAASSPAAGAGANIGISGAAALTAALYVVIRPGLGYAAFAIQEAIDARAPRR